MKNLKTFELFNNDVTFEEYFNHGNTGGDFSNVFDIDCSNENLINLDGIEKCKNLKQLFCSWNKISSLKPINNINLKELYISKNRLSSIEDIKNLTKLELLDISNNKIISLKGIEKLTNLKELYCFNNYINWEENIELPKYLKVLRSDKFNSIEEYRKQNS